MESNKKSDQKTANRQEDVHDIDLRLRAVLETAATGIITIDAEGTIDSFNPAAERMFGYSADEVIGQNVRVLMPSPYREEHNEYLSRYRRTGERHIIGIGREVVGRRKDGTTFPMDLAVSEAFGGGMFTGIISDLTERKRTEARLASIGRILDQSLNEIYIFDAQTLKFIEINHGACENLGYTIEELRRLTPLDLKPEFTAKSLDEVLRPLRIGEKEHVGFQTVHRRKDGSQYAVDVHLQMSSLDSSPVFIAMILDITQRRAAEERAVQAERLAAIGQMVAGLAHESRNALQRSQSCLELLALELAGQPEVLDLVGRIQKAQDHLHHLYEEVRGYAAPINLHAKECDLKEIWRETWSHLEMMRKDKSVTLREESDGLELRCRVDRHALGQVFRNVLENAIVACGEPGEIVIRCAQAVLDRAPAVRLSVRDNGPGLDEEQAARIFDPFYTTKTQGTGLGMAIAKRIIESHGGEMEVGNAGAPGAEIVITLPRERP